MSQKKNRRNESFRSAKERNKERQAQHRFLDRHAQVQSATNNVSSIPLSCNEQSQIIDGFGSVVASCDVVFKEEHAEKDPLYLFFYRAFLKSKIDIVAMICQPAVSIFNNHSNVSGFFNASESSRLAFSEPIVFGGIWDRHLEPRVDNARDMLDYKNAMKFSIGFEAFHFPDSIFNETKTKILAILASLQTEKLTDVANGFEIFAIVLITLLSVVVIGGLLLCIGMGISLFYQPVAQNQNKKNSVQSNYGPPIQDIGSPENPVELGEMAVKEESGDDVCSCSAVKIVIPLSADTDDNDSRNIAPS